MTMVSGQQNILKVTLSISICIHSALLFFAFPAIQATQATTQNEELKVTIHNETILPSVENVGNTTQLKKGTIPNSPTEYHEQSITAAQNYMISDQDSEEVMMQYTDMIRSRIQHALIYPPTARKDGIEGKAYVKFVIDSTGNVLSVAMVKSSGCALLDDESVKAIYRASPFPRIPENLNKKSLSFVQGLTFTLK